MYAARWKGRTQRQPKNSPSGHHRTTLSGYVFATKACIDNREKLVKRQYLLHMLSQYGELRPTRGWDRFVSLGYPSKFQRVSRFGFVTASTSLNGIQPNFARCFAVFWAGTLYTFSGVMPRNGILPDATFTLRPSLALCYFGSVTARHSSSGRQPNFAALKRGRHLYSAERPLKVFSDRFLSRRANCGKLKGPSVRQNLRALFPTQAYSCWATLISCRILNWNLSRYNKYLLFPRDAILF